MIFSVMLTAREVMSSPVISVPPNALIEEALDRMVDCGVSGLPVVDEEQQLVGVLSEFDTLMLLGENEEHSRVAPVAVYMTRDVETIDADAELDEIAMTFYRRGVRRLPVLEEGRVIGIVSRRDLMKMVRETRSRAATANAW